MFSEIVIQTLAWSIIVNITLNWSMIANTAWQMRWKFTVSSTVGYINNCFNLIKNNISVHIPSNCQKQNMRRVVRTWKNITTVWDSFKVSKHLCFFHSVLKTVCNTIRLTRIYHKVIMIKCFNVWRCSYVPISAGNEATNSLFTHCMNKSIYQSCSIMQDISILFLLASKQLLVTLLTC